MPKVAESHESAIASPTEPLSKTELKKIRLSLDLTPEMKTAIDELASKSGTTQAEVLRRAIALLRAVKRGQEDGESVAMVKDNQVVARLVGF